MSTVHPLFFFPLQAAVQKANKGHVHEAALSLENEIDTALYHLPPHPNTLHSLLAFDDELPVKAASLDNIPHHGMAIPRSGLMSE